MTKTILHKSNLTNIHEILHKIARTVPGRFKVNVCQSLDFSFMVLNTEQVYENSDADDNSDDDDEEDENNGLTVREMHVENSMHYNLKRSHENENAAIKKIKTLLDNRRVTFEDERKSEPEKNGSIVNEDNVQPGPSGLSRLVCAFINQIVFYGSILKYRNPEAKTKPSILKKSSSKEDPDDGRVLIRCNMFRSRISPIRCLSLRGFPDITDKTLNYISKLQLDMLDVTLTGVTEQGVKKYMKNNPECRVINEQCACICRPHFFLQ